MVNPNAAGYLWAPGNTIRWGTNNVAGSTWANAGFGDTFSGYTTFSFFPDYSSECQAAYGDSGGAVFRKDGTSWQLAGIIGGLGSYSGQPANTAVYGNNTYYADLSVYRPQIVAVVPEPGTVGLAVAAVATGILGRGLRRRSRSKPWPGSKRRMVRAENLERRAL